MGVGESETRRQLGCCVFRSVADSEVEAGDEHDPLGLSWVNFAFLRYFKLL